MSIFGISFSGLFFTLATVAVFAWGVLVAVRGIRAEHPPYGEGGYTPAPARTVPVRKAA